MPTLTTSIERSGRRRRRLIAPLAAGLALTLGLASCGDSTSDGDATATTRGVDEQPGTTQAAEAQEVEVVAVDYGYSQAPQSLQAGVVQLSFTNEGEVEHDVNLLEIGDTPIDQFVADFPPVLEGGPFPDYAGSVASPAFAGPGETTEVTFTVSEGTYAMFCTFDGDAEAAPEEGAEEGEEPVGPAHFTRGMVQVLEVGPGDDDAVLPEADGSITAVDYGFDVDVSDGDETITFVNEGPEQIHFASVSVFPEGTDEEAARAAFDAMLQSEDGTVPEGVPEPEEFAFSGIYSSGLGGNFKLNEGAFASGRTYVVSCFIQDRAGGPPHAIANEMYRVFTVE